MKFTIKEARQYGGFTQANIAEALGVSTKTYQSYEANRVAMRINTAQKFSELTKVPISDIIFLVPNYG